MEEHSVPLRDPEEIGIRQRYPVRKPAIEQAMYRAGSEIGVRVSRTHPDEWTSRVGQPSSA